MMTGEEKQKLQDFSFGKLLRQIKAETGLSFTKMAELSGIPYKDLYKYAFHEDKKPNYVEFYLFMDFINYDTDEFLLDIIGRDHDLVDIRHYISLLTPQEKRLLDQLHMMEEEQRNKFIEKTSVILDLIIGEGEELNEPIIEEISL